MIASDLKKMISEKVDISRDENKKVEIVLNNKKYFISNFQSGINTCKIEVTRKNFSPFTVSEFLNIFEKVENQTSVSLVNLDDSSKLNVNDIYTGSHFVELLAEKINL